MTVEAQSPIVIYGEADKTIEVRLDTEKSMVWLAERQMGGLFDRSLENMLMHLKNIFKDNAFCETVTTKDFLSVHIDERREARRNLKHYIFDIDISVSYRINSLHAIHFHQWTTYTLRKYLAQGWILNRQHIQANAREREVRCI